MRTSPGGPLVMCASPLPLVSYKLTGPLTVNLPLKLPSTPEFEAQPATTVIDSATIASHAFLFVCVISICFRFRNKDYRAPFLSSYTKRCNWKFRESTVAKDQSATVEDSVI